MSLAHLFARRRLLLVTGKGGVGKTTVAVAAARALADRGRRVLALEVDPRENAHQMLGVPPSGGEVTAVDERLFLQNLQPRAVLDRVVREQLLVGPVVRRVLRSPVYHHFAEGAPGLRELAVLGHALRLLRGIDVPPALAAGGPPDTIVLDAPASGHGVALLAAPRLVADVISEGPFGELAGELALLVGDPEQCGVAVVTTADEMPVQEALELLAALAQGNGRRADAVVVNQLYPPWPAGEPEPGDELGLLWRERRRGNERELARLERAWEGPTLELPLLSLARGPGLIAALAARIAASPTARERTWT
ncbi:MAG TPA: ArsA-related P-loop ATPase [Thermoanaerobaculia bacterium]|nr:ArsA-related P-loop ATPase [Thermoanaerobaculia bacterium]